MDNQKKKKLGKIVLKSCAYVAVMCLCYKLPSILNKLNVGDKLSFLDTNFDDINLDD